MENAIKTATKHVRDNLEISMKQLQNATILSMKTLDTKQHGNNAMRECVNCLRQGLYLQAQERAW